MTESLCSRGSTASLRGRDVLSRSLSFTPFCPLPSSSSFSRFKLDFARIPLSPPFLITRTVKSTCHVSTSYICCIFSSASKIRPASKKLRPNFGGETSREGRRDEGWREEVMFLLPEREQVISSAVGVHGGFFDTRLTRGSWTSQGKDEEGEVG